MFTNRPAQIEGLFIVIENGNLHGLKHCCDDLTKRGTPAVITIGEKMIDENPGVVKDLSDRGFEFSGKTSAESQADEPYERQLAELTRVQDKIGRCTNKPMSAITGKHFLTNEATLKVAHKLGVPYVLIRGTSGLGATVYRAKEYTPIMLALSMIPAKGGGLGSLSEQILWASGKTPENFRQSLFDVKERKVTLGIHTSMGATKLRWWNVYQDFLNANLVTWKSLAEFARDPVVLKSAEIPRNSEITYGTPTPRIPLEQEPEYIPED